MNVKYMIGMTCRKTGNLKKSQPKSFASGLKINTIKGVVINQKTGNPAFTFIEDKSVIDTHRCLLIDEFGNNVHKNDIQRQREFHKRKRVKNRNTINPC